MKAEPIIEASIQPQPLTADDIVRRFLPDVYAYVSRRLPKEQDAEDVTAETFQAAFSSLQRIHGDDPKLWLFGIARRKVADAYRRERRRREDPLGASGPSTAAMHSDLERADAVAAVRRIVLALPDDQREALLLQHLEGLSIGEIAKVMGRSHAAVNSLLQRARNGAYRLGKPFFVEDNS